MLLLLILYPLLVSTLSTRRSLTCTTPEPKTPNLARDWNFAEGAGSVFMLYVMLHPLELIHQRPPPFTVQSYMQC